MKIIFRVILAVCIVAFIKVETAAQTNSLADFTYSVKLTFQTYGLPFRNLASGFRNIGVAVSADCPLNGKRQVYQSLVLGYQTHTHHETGYYINTQVSYRSVVFNAIEPAVAVGVGWLHSVANPKNPYYNYTGNNWQKSSRQTKGHWQVPLGFGLTLHQPDRPQVARLHVSYETVAILRYNQNFLALPYSLLGVGTQFQFSSAKDKEPKL